jgi:hypothetical protein
MNKTSTQQRHNRVSELNDRFRQTLEGGHVMLTDGLVSLGPLAIDHILTAVREFSKFDTANDPHAEHDFGSFSHAGQMIVWKIDYYVRRLECGSPDPADPLVTRRVLTVMLAAEY